MTMNAFHPLSVTRLARDIRNGLSPVAVVQGCLDRITAQNPTLRALIHVDAAGALAAAARAEAELRAGRDRGPLHGIPVALKDVVDVAGWTTTGGSRLFDGTQARRDADCVQNLRASGAVILGKANLHELTAGGHDNPWFGKVVNPRDPARGTAGTSSGSAAAVAAGFCAVAVGSDTGGSNRSVAAATGLYGLRPSHGLVPTRGSLPTAPSLDCLGPIGTSIPDIRAALAAMAGIPAPHPLTPDPATLTITICPDLYGDDLDGAVRAGVEGWLDHCRSLGARVVRHPFPGAQQLVDAGLTILMYEFARAYGALIHEDPDAVGPAPRQFLDQALALTPTQYDAARTTRADATARLAAMMAGADLLAIPTAPGLAPRLSDETTRINGRDVPFGLAGGRFRRWANMLDLPALAMPVPSGQPLPASIQLAARTGQDFTLLDRAQALFHPATPGIPP